MTVDEKKWGANRHDWSEHFMQNTAIIYKIGLYLSARHDEKGNKMLHIDTHTNSHPPTISNLDWTIRQDSVAMYH